VASVTLDRVGKVYPDGTKAVDELSLEVEDGEFVVFVGPSGCGKTSALRMIAGLEDVTTGTIRIGDRVVNDLEPRSRDIAMVFQNYALYPHMNVYENMVFGLRMRKVPRREQRAKVETAAAILGLSDMLNRKPGMLSGGQRQRVAMGRAIVRDPQVFLMDEPLSNLDAKLRVQMRAEVSRIQHEFGTTTVYVTHDQVEAMTMGDRVAVMRRGRLQQMEAPQRLYDEPANLFEATCIGSPAMNVLEGELAVAADGRLSVSLGEDRLDIPETALDTHPALRSYVGRKLAVGIRPEQLGDVGDEPMHGRSIRGVVKVVEALGSELLVHVDVSAGPILVDEVVEASTVDAADASLMATLMTAADKIHAGVVGRLQPNAPVSVGDSIVLAVDVGKLHFFDLETGLVIHG
jgi:multiple sugar transport system ATP-binding protein